MFHRIGIALCLSMIATTAWGISPSGLSPSAIELRDPGTDQIDLPDDCLWVTTLPVEENGVYQYCELDLRDSGGHSLDHYNVSQDFFTEEDCGNFIQVHDMNEEPGGCNGSWEPEIRTCTSHHSPGCHSVDCRDGGYEPYIFGAFIYGRMPLPSPRSK